MSKYITEDGIITSTKPTNYISLRNDYTGNLYQNLIIDFLDLERNIIETECFSEEPDDNELLYMILKYKATYAQKSYLYSPETIYDIEESE